MGSGSIDRSPSPCRGMPADGAPPMLRRPAMPDIIAEPPGDDPLVASSRQHTEPRERGRRDELTGLLDRRGFDELLAAALADAREGDVPVGLLLLELDDLGAMNDRLGRESGDAVLGHVARLVDETTRHRDCVCRIGRDELAVVLVRADAG